jgi:hypothetical protein
MLYWYSVTLLAFEAGSVMNTRLSRMAFGDISETNLMFTEKVGAAFDVCSILARGGNGSKVIECYRNHVAANAARLK